MSKTKQAILAALALALGTPVLAGEGAPPAPTVEQISRWIRALDDENYAARETAGKELVAAGRIAIGPVAKAILSESPEAAWRANGVLEQIGVSGDQQTFELVSKAFDEISKSHKQAAGKSTANLQNRWKLLRHERAIEQIARLGGRVQSSTYPDGGMVIFGGGGFGAFGGIMPAIAIDELIEAVPLVEEPADVPEKRAIEFDAIKIELLPFRIPPPAAADPFGEPRKEAELDRPAGGFFGKVLRALREVIPLGGIEEPAPPVEAVELVPDLVEFAEVGFDIGLAEFSGEEVGGGGGAHSVHIGKEWKGTAQDFKLFQDVLQLASVELAEIEVTGAHLDQLSQLAELKQLNLQRCRFDRAALEKLKKARPELAVLTFGDAVLGISGEAQGEGFHISFVAPNSGAQAAGIQVDDIIKSIGGEELRTFERLTHIIASHKTGDKLSVKFERQGKPQSVEVTLKTREASN